jgi:ribosome biogenesis protein MAK21
LQAIDALREIFIAALLPDRKLKFFEEQPLSAVPSSKDGLRRLLYYYVEDQIKRRCS